MPDEVVACHLDISYLSVYSDCSWCSGHVMLSQRPGDNNSYRLATVYWETSVHIIYSSLKTLSFNILTK